MLTLLSPDSYTGTIRPILVLGLVTLNLHPFSLTAPGIPHTLCIEFRISIVYHVRHMVAMKNRDNGWREKKTMKRSGQFRRLAVLALIICATSMVASASPIFTFASFTERGTGGTLFAYLNNGPSSLFGTTNTGNAADVGVGAPGIPILFQYQTILGSLPGPLQGTLLAHMIMNAPVAGPASFDFISGNSSERIGGSIFITLDTPYLGQNNRSEER